ncbi:acyl-CoA thioesterase [Alkalihalobacillus sp. LMS39]|uniref:acyl-CoA thioesterase n=1 Tax=Alkalihalobacillus sp. LMS39 TaxID=2924032 RepID=UPI001FB4D652|nr:acyl-CoA thioesterase [Alkalihalobacillus sp. LMS39]UOE96525.1 acyl-CoA thioesterase [Alkalihalobacillus sp. LMS39]
MVKIPYIENIADWAEEFQFSSPIHVRFSETDAFGHVNNTKVFAYFEEARINYFQELGLMREWMSKESEAIVVTADLQCNYIRQIFFGNQLRVFVKVHHIGTTSIDVHYMVKNEKDEICLTGRGLIVQVSKQTGKSIPWTEETKSHFLK